MSAINLRSLYLVQHSPSFFFFSVTHKSGWSSQSLTGWSVIHLRTQAATISLQESLYPLLPSMLSVYWQVPRQQPSRTPAPLWKERSCACGTLGRLGQFCRPKHREIVARSVPRHVNALRRFEKCSLQMNHSSPRRSCQQFVQHRDTLCMWTGRSAARFSSCARL